MAFRRWLNPSKSGGLGSSKSLTALDEPHALQDAMKSAALIMNDEVERAETELSNGTSPFHKLGRATTLFLRATLGFEKDVMDQAASLLSEAEESASEHQRRAIRDPQSAHQSKIYPAGSEYSLCHAESQLMSAVLGVLNESLTESLRGFYKLRKAFVALQEIIEAENRYMENYAAGKSSLATGTEQQASKLSSVENGSGVLTPAEGSDNGDNEDLEFQDAEEEHHDQPTPTTYRGHTELPDAERLNLQEMANGEPVGNGSISNPPPPPHQPGDTTHFAETQDGDLNFTNVTSDPIDLFIHSGTALCYGLLNLILSLIPPSFGKLLSILSFRGDRETGMRLLWKATAFKENVNGGFAGLITLGFHNVTIALCDIRSREAYPEARLRLLLRDMRTMYPKSVLWLLEEARMASADQQLEREVELLSNKSVTSPLKQVEALRVFQTAHAFMYMHRYQECADSFEKCVKLNSWSHGLYYYIAAACHVELYRFYRETDPNKAIGHKQTADGLFKKSTSQTGKKRLMARQMPLDVFIARKATKWASRAKARGCDLIDAIGVSPVEEMIYFWAGYKRMSASHLETSLQRLTWSEDNQLNPHWEREPIDERAILAVLKATALRCLGRVDEARSALSKGVFCYDWHQIKACEHADNWSLPVAHYEKAVCHWQEAGGQYGDRGKLQECSDEIMKVEKWESFDLDARVGMKVTTARVTLKQLGISSS